MFYAIAALAYNLMKAVQLLCLPDECQGWTVPASGKNHPGTALRPFRRPGDPSPMSPRALPDPA
jgi:hypothetical protein